MSSDSEGEKNSRSSVPMLTMHNWNSEFKENFTHHAMRYGQVARILMIESDPYQQYPEVTFDMRELRPINIDPANREADDTDAPQDNDDPTPAGEIRVFRSVRRYSNNQDGRAAFEQDFKTVGKWTEKKMKLISVLLRKMSRQVKEKVTTHPQYEQAYTNCDLLGLWQITRVTALGRGAVSVYQLTTRIIRLRQTDTFAKYAKDYTSAALDLQRQGDAETVLRKVLNTLFILGLNQEEFKDVLTPIYGTNEWPDHTQLVADLHTYSEARRSVQELRDPEVKEGKIAGYAVDTNAKGGCWNCGSKSHFKKECRAPPSRCDICGMLGHKEEYCLKKHKKDDDVQHGKGRRHDQKDSRRKERQQPKKKSHKSERRSRNIKKSMAYHSKTTQSEEEDDSYEESEQLHEEEESFDESSSVEGYMVKPDRIITERIIIDSGCKGAHILRPQASDLLTQTVKDDKLVYGLGGRSLKATSRGQLGQADLGKALVVPDADANLLSLPELLRKTRGSVEGNVNELKIKDKEGNLMITATNVGDGYWSCLPEDVAKITCYMNDTDIESDDKDDKHEESNPVDPVPFHCNAEERQRALQCQDLCKQLGHPGHDALMKALDHGNFNNTTLTSQDVRNMLRLFGPCKECIEAKMTADPKPRTSASEPARAVGEVLHADLLSLNIPSIGNHTQLLVAVCEKTGYIQVIPLPTKSTKDLCQGFDAIISQYRSYGHVVKRIHTDHERNFVKCKVFLGHKGVEYVCMPAGHHEVLAERSIRVLKERFRALLATLPYELPERLYAEAYVAAARSMTLTPRKRSGLYTPAQLVEHRKPLIPRFYFGQTGLFHRRRADAPDSRAEWGIFLSHGSGPRSLRAYLPMRGSVYSMMKFTPHSSYPAEWKLLPRIRPITTVPQLKYDQKSVIPDQKGEDLVAPAPFTVPEITTTVPLPLPPPVPPPPPAPYHPPSPPQAPQQSTPTSSQPIQTTVSKPLREQTSKGEDTKDSSMVPPHTSPRRTRRTHATNWKDGPARLLGMDIQTTGTEKRVIRSQTKALLCTEKGSCTPTAYRLSMRAALRDPERRQTALQAIRDEIRNMEDNNVMKPTRYANVPPELRQSIIPVFMFLKDKYKADGSFDKVKARLVANGAAQNPEDVGETFSPTVNPITFFTQINVTTHRRALLSSYDIKGAFLLAEITDGRRMFLRIPRDVTQHWIKLYPKHQNYVESNGSMIVELRKYVYGLQESPHEFNKLLKSHFEKLGLKQSVPDPSLFTMDTKDGKILVCAHVDDLLLTAPNRKWQRWFEDGLRTRFEIVCQYEQLSYLGMNIKYSAKRDSIHVSQTGYAQDLVKKTLGDDLIRKPPASPATQLLLEPPRENERTVDKRSFLSTVMSVMYLARLTRPDILMPVTVLAARCSNPTEKDEVCLRRVIRYIAGTLDMGLMFNANHEIDPVMYADASHGLHYDGRGHGGVTISYGSAPVMTKSFKLKLVTVSSCESELVLLQDGVTYVDWIEMLLVVVGFPTSRPIPVYQDNKSTIIVATSGGNFKRTKHMLIKQKFVQERIENGSITLRYVPTTEMTADILTKPQSGAIFEAHKRRLFLFPQPETI